MTLDGVMAVILWYFNESVTFESQLRQIGLKLNPHYMQHKCSLKNLVLACNILWRYRREIMENECTKAKHATVKSRNLTNIAR